MHPYTYSVSLRIKHPNNDLTYLDKFLNLESKRVWKAGEGRTTPKGTKLEGKNTESYWYTELARNEESESCSLEDMLIRWTNKLNTYELAFKKIVSEGGSVEYFIWIYCDRNLGFELNNDLLQNISKLGIKLGIVCDP